MLYSVVREIFSLENEITLLTPIDFFVAVFVTLLCIESIVREVTSDYPDLASTLLHHGMILLTSGYYAYLG